MTYRLNHSVAALVLTGMLGLLQAGAADAVKVDGEIGPRVDKDLASRDSRYAAYPDTQTALVRLTTIDAKALQSVRERNSRVDSDPKAFQIGVDRLIADSTQDKASPELTWQELPTGAHLTRFAVTSPGAEALRVGLALQALPENAELRFFADGGLRSVVPAVTGGEIKRQLSASVYWTPVTPGERQTVEIYLPPLPRENAPAAVHFTVDRVAHLFASPYGNLDGLKVSDFCEIDANCVSNPSQAYLNAKNAVARMSFQDGGSFVCTGTLLNDTVSSTFIPYFYSANHCISTQAVANTLVTFWFEESTSCGSGVAGPRTQVSGGAALLYNNAATDALLLRLNSPAPTAAAFEGWDAAPIASNVSILVLHHPAGDVKKVTQGLTTGFGTYNGAGSFIRAGYTSASTEGGSSGAGLLTFASGQYYLRGGLYGGSASCSNTGSVSTPANTDAYSRFDVVYPNIAQFLNPGTTTQFAVNVTRGGTGSGTVTSSPAGINCGSTCSANFDSGTAVVLSATAASGSTFTSWSGCDSSNGATCNVNANAIRNVTANFAGSGGGTTVLTNGVTVSNLSGASDSQTFFTLTIPAGATNLRVQTTGAAGNTGDPDLYVRFGAAPTLTVYDCRGFDTGPAGLCTFPSPSAGTWHVMIHAFQAPYTGLNLVASWTTASGGGVDEPAFTNFLLPLPANPPFPNCPGGYFVAVIDDGPGAGLSPGIFGLALQLNAPGTQRLEGGLNFGGLLDGSQVAFAGFNFQNPANEMQRLDMILTGNPTSSLGGTLPVRIKVTRRPSANVEELVLETTANLTQAQSTLRSINLTPSFYAVTVGPEGAPNVPGGAADGQVFVTLSSQYVDRPGGGFFGGVVVGGYHAANPFGGVSGFASFCLGSQHSSDARLYAAPSYGITGAHDLRLRLLDHASREVISVPQ
jgi:hypothetical protein